MESTVFWDVTRAVWKQSVLGPRSESGTHTLATFGFVCGDYPISQALFPEPRPNNRFLNLKALS
jgi:hypothetical protein